MPRTTRHLRAITATAAAAAMLAAAPPSALARATDGTIIRVAGTTPGFAGDGGPAVQAQMDTPRDIAFLGPNSFAVADFNNDRIRQVAPNGIITTIAGSSRGLSGDGGPAKGAELDRPRGITALPGGGYLIADTFNDRIRRVAPNGTITTVAGTSQGLAGDGGPASAARLSLPSDTAILPDGGYLIADTGNSRIRRVAPGGTIATVAGTTQGFGGDGAAATAAQLNQPRDMTVASDGALLIADTGNDRVRRVAPDGTITTVAGVGAGFSGDGDPARDAALRGPFSVAALPNGGFLFTDTGNDRVRRVTPLGAIFTVVGTTTGRAGDGGLAKAAQLNQPGAVEIAPTGGFLVADSNNATVRSVSDVGAVPAPVAGRSVGVVPDANGVVVEPAGTGAFLPLAEEDLVPVASHVDVTTGRIDVSLADASGAQQTAQLDDGAFTITQTAAAQPFTDFRLPSLTDCGPTPAQPAPAARAAGLRWPVAFAARRRAKRKRKPSRRLWVTEKGGRWRTRTGAVTATAVGTVWHTALRCDGTLVSVREGQVSVRDQVHQRTILLNAGQSFLVKTRGAKAGV